jgi:putative ABC transport system permease protein
MDLMGAVTYVARRRLRHHAVTLAVAGVVLGIGFGLCFASLAAARRTASAYERILAASDAPDAAVTHRAPPDEAEAALRTIPGVADQRVYAGFIGVAGGIDPLYSRGLLAPTDDEFPLEHPNMRAGRLPHPDAVDELFVNGVVADGTGLRVGDEVDFTFVTADFDDQVEASATVVGIGDLPSDAVTDETTLRSIFMFTRAFYEAHRDLTVYSVSNIDLFPGVDPNRELAPAVSELGYELQSARGQEQQSVSDALRPTLVVLVALGVLAFGATAVGTAQVIQRDRDRWRADSATLRAAGMVRRQVRLVQLVTTGVLAAVAVATALMTVVLASPIAPLGPLHDLDPGQGVSFDAAVAALGVVAILVTIGGLALAFSAAPGRAATVPSSSSAAFVNAIGRPASFAGLLLAFRTSRGRGRALRTVTAAAIAAAVFALSGAFVASAVALSGTPASYGFDADLLAVNQYGNQSEAELAAAFGNDDVVAATGFTAGTFLLEGQAVPGIAATEIKGEVMPTLVRGESVEDDDEIVVGEDTLARLGADLGDTVSARTGTPGIERTEPVDLRIVGVATFPPVNQAGLDGSRLGNGAVVTRGAYVRMGGDPANDPEYTAVRLAGDVSPAAVIAANPDGFHDAAQSATSWFTDTKPAELRQLDVAMPYLVGALAVAFLIVLAVLVHALWTLVRAHRREVAVLRAMGCTTRQLDEVTSWQVTPYMLAAFAGLPIGIAIGRIAFTRFAESLAVVESASTPFLFVLVLIGAVIGAALVAIAVSVAVARPYRAAAVLREA